MNKTGMASFIMSWLMIAALFSPTVALTITDADWLPITGGPTGVQAMAMDSGGNIYVGGQFSYIGGNTVIGYKYDTISNGEIFKIPIMDTIVVLNNIAKWDGMRWSALDSGVSVGPSTYSPPRVNALAVIGTDLYVGGVFLKAGRNVDVRHIAKWNGTSWSSVGPGFTDQVQALAAVGTDVYAGGNFSKIYGGDSVKGIAKWNGSAWSSLSVKLANSVTGYPVVSCIAPSGTDLYVGGYFSFSTIGNPVSIAKWNGSAWSALGSGLAGGGVTVWSLAVDGSDVYAGGGQFLTAGGIASANIAKWNGTSWSGFGSGIEGGQTSVHAVAVQGPNVFVTGSWFSTAGGVAVNNIAHWDGTAWKTMGQGLNGYAGAFMFNKDHTVLYVGGDFTAAGGKPSRGIAGVLLAPMSAPTIPVQLIKYVPDTANVNLTWIKGNGRGRIVAISSENTGSPVPKDSTTYAPSIVFGSGDTVGMGSWYCVYNGDTGTMLTVSGLKPGTTYYLAAFEYNNKPGSERFFKSSVGKNIFITLPSGVNPVALDTVRADSALCAWHGVVSATRYEFQMASDTAFKAGLNRDTSVTDSSKKITGLADGAFFWRVRASNGSGFGAWSKRQKTVVNIPVSGAHSAPAALKSFAFVVKAGTVNYQLPFACKVSLRMFDMQGRLAATLVDAMQASGRYIIPGIKFNLATSSYTVVFKAGSFNVQQLLTVVR